MKTQPQICNEFDQTMIVVEELGLTLESNETNFILSKEGDEVFVSSTVDGIAGFIAGLEFQKAMS